MFSSFEGSTLYLEHLELVMLQNRDEDRIKVVPRNNKVKMPRLHTLYIKIHCSPAWLMNLLNSFEMPVIRTLAVCADMYEPKMNFSLPNLPTLEVLSLPSRWGFYWEGVRTNSHIDTLALHSSRLEYDEMVNSIQCRRLIVKETGDISEDTVGKLIRALKAKGRIRHIALYGCGYKSEWDEVKAMCGDIELNVYEKHLDLYK